MNKLREVRGTNDVEKCILPHRSIDPWKVLTEEVVEVKDVHKLKGGLEKHVNGDGTE